MSLPDRADRFDHPHLATSGTCAPEHKKHSFTQSGARVRSQPVFVETFFLGIGQDTALEQETLLVDTAIMGQPQTSILGQLDGTATPPPGSVPHGVVARSLRVADRIRAWDEASAKEPKLPSLPLRQNTRGFFSSLLGGKVRPFTRRDSVGSPVRSPPPEKQPAIKNPNLHAPTPQKVLRDISPGLGTRIVDTSRGDHDFDVVHSGFGRRETKAFAVRRTTHPHETHQQNRGRVDIPATSAPMCVRHGRRLVPSENRPGATTEGMERSIKGAYFTTGFKIRSQVDVTSPWFIPTNYLTKREGTVMSPDICPDCEAEHRIWRRETLQDTQESDATVRHLSLHVQEPSSVSSSTAAEYGSIAQPSRISLAGTVDGHRSANLLYSDTNDMPMDKVGSVIAADLGDLLDAIIIEHRGTLDRVITNLRNGTPDGLTYQTMAQDLASLSTSMAGLQSNGPPVTG